MKFTHHKTPVAVTLCLLGCLLLLGPAQADSTVNKSIRIADGQEVGSSLSSVNGGITVGAKAAVDGSAETVNGSISIRDGATIRGLETVNGSIRVANEVIVDGNVESVNGGISTQEGTRIYGWIETVNGRLELSGTTVNGSVSTQNGSVSLLNGSRLQGDVVIGSSKSSWFDRFFGWGRKNGLKIYLDGASVIEGDIINRDEDREVQVILSGDAEVRGQIQNAELIRK